MSDQDPRPDLPRQTRGPEPSLVVSDELRAMMRRPGEAGSLEARVKELQQRMTIVERTLQLVVDALPAERDEALPLSGADPTGELRALVEGMRADHADV